MVIDKIFLFSTDLDDSNNNVIDIIDSNFAINTFDYWFVETFLPIQYRKRTIEQGFNKGLNIDSQLNCVITLNKKVVDSEIFEYFNYNYIVIKQDIEHYYYGFISNISENGDSTITLFITYDVWNNNLKYMQSKMVKENINTDVGSDNFLSVQSHMVEYIENNENTVTPIFYPLNIQTGKMKYNTESFVTTHNVDSDIVCDLLCLKIICSEKPQFTWKHDLIEYDFSLKESAVGSLNTYYIPIALKDGNNNFLPIRLYGNDIANVDGNNTTSWVSPTNMFYNGYPVLKYDYFSKLSNYIISAELTYNIPFDITVALEDNIYTVTFDSNSVKVVFVNEAIADPLSGKFDGIGFGTPVIVPIRNNQNTYSEKVYTIYSRSIPKSLLVSDNRIDYCNGIFKTYPFNKIVMKSGANSKVIEPINNTKQCNIKFKYNTDTVGYKIVYYDNNDNPILDLNEYIFLSNSQETSFSKDSLEYYKLTKGAQAETALQSQLFNSALTGIASYATGNYVGMANSIVNFGQSIMQYKNNLVASDRTVDSYVKPLQRGEISLDYSDQIRIINDVFIETDENNKRLNNEIFLKGYNFIHRKNLFGYNKYYFDYNQGEDLYISLPISNYEKLLIKQLYSRGFTRNHYRYNPDISKIEQRLPTNKNVNNVDYFIMEGV